METSIHVTLDGVDISDEVSADLLSFSYTDNEEDEADDLQIRLHDADGHWLRQWIGDTVSAAAATTVSGNRKTKGLDISAAIAVKNAQGMQRTECGRFELDSIRASGPPSTVTLKGTSLPYGNGIRTEQRDKAWEGYTLSRIGQEIAGNASLKFVYDSSNDPSYRRVEQTRETDIAFLQKLCHNAGLSLKVADMQLVVFDQAKYEARSPGMTIAWMDGSYTKYDLSTSEGDVRYDACEVRYYHPGLQQMITGHAEAENDGESTDGSEKQLLVVTGHRVESTGEANALATQMLRLHNKYEKSAALTMLGNPMLGAGMTVALSGFGAWDGKYLIKQARHEVSANGYTTRLTLRWVLGQENLSVETIAAEKKTNSKSSNNSNNSSNNKGDRYW